MTCLTCVNTFVWKSWGSRFTIGIRYGGKAKRTEYECCKTVQWCKIDRGGRLFFVKDTMDNQGDVTIVRETGRAENLEILMYTRTNCGHSKLVRYHMLFCRCGRRLQNFVCPVTRGNKVTVLILKECAI